MLECDFVVYRFHMFPSSHCVVSNCVLPMCPYCVFFPSLTPGLRECTVMAAASAVRVRASPHWLEILHMCNI